MRRLVHRRARVLDVPQPANVAPGLEALEGEEGGFGGFEVVGEAENGQKALEKWSELRPDLTTMDITMPEMDGISAVKEIKKIDPNAKVIMCSAMGQQAMVIEAIQSGARDFIVKPFQPDRVIEAVRKALG